MSNNRFGGWMLVAGALAGIVTMIFHPVGHPGVLSPHEVATLALLTRAVHGLGVASLPLVFLGMLTLTRHLSGGGSRLPLAALVVYGFAAAAILVAASVSGFVAPRLLGRLVAGDPLLDTRRLLLDYTFQLNQAFASVFVVGSSVAIILWSSAMVRGQRMTAVLGIYGLVLGVVILGATLGGHLVPDVHGFGLVAFTQAIWFISAGIQLMRTADPGERTAHGRTSGEALTGEGV